MGYRPIVYKQNDIEVDTSILQYLERDEKTSFFDNMNKYLEKLSNEYGINYHIDEFAEDSKTYITCEKLLPIDIDNMPTIFTDKEKEMTKYLQEVANNARYVKDYNEDLVITWG